MNEEDQLNRIESKLDEIIEGGWTKKACDNDGNCYRINEHTNELEKNGVNLGTFEDVEVKSDE